MALEKKERDREEIIKLFRYFNQKSALRPEDFEKGYLNRY
jgi:hypothetical protein